MFTCKIIPLALCVSFLSLFSGIAAYIQGVRDGRFAGGYLNFIGEVTTALTAGLSVFFLGVWQQYPESLTCLFSLISAANGRASMDFLKQQVFMKKISGDKQ